MSNPALLVPHIVLYSRENCNRDLEKNAIEVTFLSIDHPPDHQFSISLSIPLKTSRIFSTPEIDPRLTDEAYVSMAIDHQEKILIKPISELNLLSSINAELSIDGEIALVPLTRLYDMPTMDFDADVGHRKVKGRVRVFKPINGSKDLDIVAASKLIQVSPLVITGPVVVKPDCLQQEIDPIDFEAIASS